MRVGRAGWEEHLAQVSGQREGEGVQW
jgi:hypothetical protein